MVRKWAERIENYKEIACSAEDVAVVYRYQRHNAGWGGLAN